MCRHGAPQPACELLPAHGRAEACLLALLAAQALREGARAWEEGRTDLPLPAEQALLLPATPLFLAQKGRAEGMQDRGLACELLYGTHPESSPYGRASGYILIHPDMPMATWNLPPQTSGRCDFQGIPEAHLPSQRLPSWDDKLPPVCLTPSHPRLWRRDQTYPSRQPCAVWAELGRLEEEGRGMPSRHGAEEWWWACLLCHHDLKAGRHWPSGRI